MDARVTVRPEIAMSGPWEEASTTLCPATLTALLHTRSSGYSREFLRETVLAWAARKWPELFIGRNACEPLFESRSGASRVQVGRACSGNYTWSFRGIRPDVTGLRSWETRVLVVGNDEHDFVGVSTGYLGDVGRAVLVSQPAFLSGLIDHLPFEDGGYPVHTDERQVFDEPGLVNLQDHLLSEHRTLPILVVGCATSSSESRTWKDPHRIDARSIARQLCGLAHVVRLGPPILARLESRTGPDMALRAGEARLCLPGCGDIGHPQRRRCTKARLETIHFVAGDVAARAGAATHAWSVSASRRMDFNALWSTAADA